VPPDDAALTRRGLLRGMGAGLLGLWQVRLALAVGTVGVGEGVRQAAHAVDTPFMTPLRVPRALTGDHITLVAREALVQVLPGMPTRMWTFNGTFPGPLIRRPSGRPVRVTVQHRLPAKVGTLTIHHHGSHSASAEDGQPERNVIAPGGQRTYVYGLREDGKPERAAMQWYHDHSHFRTTRNVWHGLAGMFIVDDAVDSALPLPKGQYDVPLMITERSFDASNQLTEQFVVYTEDPTNPAPPGVGGGYAPDDDLFGTRFLVNGVERPFFDVSPRRYRLRFLNTSPFRPYNLRLSDGGPMTQIATESGLLPAPLSRTEILLGPAERAEVVVDFAGRAGRTLRLETAEVSGAGPVPVTSPAIAPLLEFRVARRALSRDTSKVPSRLRPLPGWVAQASPQPHRIWAFGVGANEQGRAAWTINGRAFDHTRVDARPELGAVETWLLVNASPVAKSHYIHIHDVDWKVLSRNGAAPAPGEDGLKETFRLDPGEVVVVAAKLTDHLGPYMIHCHMLQHEDHGMMTTFEVVEPGHGDRVVPGLDAALYRSIASPGLRRQIEQVVRAAVDGRPAPATALPEPSDEVLATLPWLLTENPAYICRP
jgi:spore coat protein A